MRALLTILVCLPCFAVAGTPSGVPDGDEIRRVLSYYDGEVSEAPLLVEAKLCTEIGKEAEMKNECMGEIKTSLQAETDVYLWLNFMVPRHSPDQKILIQFNHDGITRQAREATIQSAIRFRTWKKFRADRPGKWTIQVLHDADDGAREMERIEVQVLRPSVADAAD